MYIFKIDNILVARLILISIWVIIEFYRLDLGFNANIKESVMFIVILIKKFLNVF